MDDLSPKSFFKLEAFEHKALFEGVAFVWDALSRLAGYLEKLELGNIEVEIPRGVYLENPEQISIGKGTVIEPGVMIQGPCVIGPDCEIRHGAYLRGPVLIGRGCVMGHASEVKHSILLNGARAPHFNFVGDSILGNEVNLGAGAKLANYRFDKKTVSVLFRSEKISTGLRKFGAVIGDLGKLGCNVVTNPGTLLGPSVFCYPNLTIHGCISPGTTLNRD
jgi:NDP-sugar pyrophosphorylase family protein